MKPRLYIRRVGSSYWWVLECRGMSFWIGEVKKCGVHEVIKKARGYL